MSEIEDSEDKSVVFWNDIGTSQSCFVVFMFIRVKIELFSREGQIFPRESNFDIFPGK